MRRAWYAPQGYYPDGRAKPWRPCIIITAPKTGRIVRIEYSDRTQECCPRYALRSFAKVQS